MTAGRYLTSHENAPLGSARMPIKLRAFVFLFALFLFVLPIPGTIAIRNVLLLSLLGLVVLLWRECDLATWFKTQRARRLLFWLGMLTLWLLLQAVWLSDETGWVLKEIRGQWLPALLAGSLGAAAVLIGLHHGLSRQRLLAGLVLVFLAQVVFSLLATLPAFLETGAFPQGKTLLTAGKLEISYWNNLLLAFLAVDGLSRWRYRQAITALPLLVLVAGILLAILSNMAFGARNGIIGSGMLLFSLALLVLWRERQRIGTGKALGFVASAIALMGLLAWANYQLDPRWMQFEETAQIAWHGEGDAWCHPDSASFPLLRSGEPVEASAYLRIAWIRAGFDLVAEYPYGVGYGRNAFGHALRKTTNTQLGHSHSGLLDWTIGVGLPGLLLWLGFLSWLVVLGIKRYFVRKDPAGLILAFVVGGFFGRMLLDSINRDHMIVVFFLVVFILVTLPEEPVPQ
jgi:hypothetical protein